MSDKDVRILVQRPFELGVYFGMGLIVAPVILVVLIGGAVFLVGLGGAAVGTLANSINREVRDSDGDISQPDSPQIVRQTPAITDEPAAAAPGSEPIERRKTPWAALLFGGIAVIVAVGGGLYAYHLVTNDKD